MSSNEPSKEIAPPPQSTAKQTVPSSSDSPVEAPTDIDLMVPQKYDHLTHEAMDQMLGNSKIMAASVSTTYDTSTNANNEYDNNNNNYNNNNNDDSKTLTLISEELNDNISNEIPPSKVENGRQNNDSNDKNRNNNNNNNNDNDNDNDNNNNGNTKGDDKSLMSQPQSMQKAKTVSMGRSADAEYGHLSRMGRLASQSSADTLKSPNTTTDERFLEFAEMHLAQALNEIHCPCFGKLIPCTLCCNEYSFWCCSLCLRANYNEWILIFLLFCAKILLWSVFAGEIHSACIPDGDESGNDNYCNNMWDVRLNYLYKEEVISNSTNYFVIGLWYIVIMFGSIGVTLLVDKNWRNKIVSSRDEKVIKCCNTCLCGREYARVALVLEVMFREILIVGFFNDVSTNMIKLFVGRPRPYYYDFFASDIDDDDDDVLKSFPSGHTSMAFAMYTLLTLHIAEAMTIARRRKYEIACMWELEHDKPYFLFCISIWRYFASPGVLILIAMSPIFMATWVGLSRINDNHHHYEDVIAGAFIGIIWAIIGFFIYKDEFRESSAKHDMLFEHFTSEIKLAFRRYIKKRRSIPYAPPTTSLKTNLSRESNKTGATSTNATTTTNGTNTNGNTDSAATTTEGATADIVINDNENNNHKNINNNNNSSNNSGSSERSGFDWNNFSISGFFQYGEFRKRQRSSRSCWFWCKIVCCSCDHDCSHIWQIFCCRHSPTDDANRRRVNREASLISPNISAMHHAHHAHHQYHTSYDLYNSDNNNLPSINEQMLYYSENTQFNYNNNNIASCPQCSHQFALNGMNNISKKKYGLKNNNDSEIDNDCRQTTLKSMAVSEPHNSNKNNKNNKIQNKSMNSSNNNNNNNMNMNMNMNNNNNNNSAFRYNTPITPTTGLISNMNDENSKNKRNKKNKNNKTEEKRMKKSSFGELQKSFKKAHTEHTLELNKGKTQHASSQSPSPRGKFGSGLSQTPLTQTRALSDQHYMHS